MASEEYIPRARYATLAFVGRDEHGRYRCHCVTCNDSYPLTDAQRVHGDDVTPECACDACGIALAKLAEMCDREHDEQQARFARGACTDLVEYGIRTSPRCRIY